MKVIDCSMFPVSAERIASYLKMFILSIIDRELKNKSKTKNSRSLKALIDLFGLKNIHKAIDSIYGLGGSIYVPTKGKLGTILRYLEFGGEGIGQTKIISEAVSTLNKKIGGDIHVF